MASSTTGSLNLPYYWILGCESDTENGREGTYALLKQRLSGAALSDYFAVMEVPLNLKYGRFDDLIRLADDLNKTDSACENVCRRMERMGLEVDPSLEFKILWQRNTLDVETYLSRFIWDDSKYPRNRLLGECVETIMGAVARLDEEVRVKAALFSEVRQTAQAAQKKDTVPLAQRDLIDVLTPDLVSEEDFIETEHLQTLIAVVPKLEETSFLSKYEKWSEHVVPRSAKKLPIVDRDGALFYRIVVLQKGVDEIKVAAKSQRIMTKEFSFKASAYYFKAEQRSKVEADKSRQGNVLSRICYAAFSECFVAWLHIKAIKIFVESTLRYGIPPRFSVFVIRPINRNKEQRIRKELDQILVCQKFVGKQYLTTSANAAASAQDTSANTPPEYDQDYYSYISTEIVPFAAYKGT